jgi:PncC family amidohydrolase
MISAALPSAEAATLLPPSDADLLAASQRLGQVLAQRGWQLAVAESCTGGLLGHVITQVPRASDHFLGGIVCYSNAVKEQLLGVPGSLLDEHGAVSKEVARAMVRGALAAFEPAHLALAVTGIAGPDGGSAEKPVGLTYLAAGRRGEEPVLRELRSGFDRDGNKRAAALAALELAASIVAG